MKIEIDVDSVKMLREALCAAQMYIADHGVSRRGPGYIASLGRLVAELDRHRPLGPDGRHGDRHTSTCGCQDRGDG